mgnify:FL=1
MENNSNENVTYKKKGNIAVIILIIVLLVLIGLLSYKMFIYDKKDNKENKDNDIVNKDDNKNNGDNNSKTNYDNKHLSKIDVDSTRGFVLYASHSSELYELRKPGKIGLVASSVIDKNGDAYFELYKDVKVKKEFNNLGEKGSYTIKDYNDNVRNNVPIEGYKLPLKNIRDVKTYAYGQAGMSGIFVFIDKENNASIMKIDYDYNSEDKIVVKDINLYKNVANNIISSIDEYNGNSRNFYLIDKDNNYYVFK